MRTEKFTCPFTGQKFNAYINNDNTISISNPLNKALYNFKVHGNAITIPLELFNYVELVNTKHAAEILGVTHQRITQLAKKERLIPVKINNKRMYKLAGLPIFLSSL